MQKPLSFGELAERYEQGRKTLIEQVWPILSYTEPGDQTGRAVFEHHKTGKRMTFDALGRLVPYVPHQGGKKTRRKANKKRKHSNNSRYRR